MRVDGQPVELFRANFIMRGIYLPAGKHAIEFEFTQPLTALYVSLSALAVGVVLLILLFVSNRPSEPPDSPAAK